MPEEPIAVAWHPRDGSSFFVCFESGVARFDGSSGEPTGEMEQASACRSMAVITEEQLLGKPHAKGGALIVLTGGEDGKVRVFDGAGCGLLRVVDLGHKKRIRSIQAVPAAAAAT